MYLLTENFNKGMDARRMALTSKPGTLQELINCHITRGGEIEKRKAFYPFKSLPSGTFGLHASNGQLWTFGSQDVSLQGGSTGPSEDPNVIVPTVNYQKLVPGLSGSSKSAQISFSGNVLVLSSCSVSYGGFRSTVSMTNHGLIDGGVYTFTFRASAGGVVLATLSGKVSVANSSLFTVDTGISQIPVNSVVEYTYSYTYISGYTTPLPRSPAMPIYSTATQTLSGTATALSSGSVCVVNFQDADIALKLRYSSPSDSTPSKVRLSFPGYSSLSGDYAIIPGTLSSSGFSVSIPALIGQSITSVYVNPCVHSVYIGSTALISSMVFWDFSASSTGDQQIAFCNSLAAAINAGTLTHGYTALSVAGSVVLYGNPPSSSTLSVSSNSILATVARQFSDIGSVMTRLVHAENFNGKIYAVAEFDGNKILHFYDGRRVLSWDMIAQSGDLSSAAASLANKIQKDGIYNSTSNAQVISIQFTQNNTSYTVVASSSDTRVTATVSTTAATSTSPQLTTVTISGIYVSSAVISVSVAGEIYSAQAGSASIGTFVRTYNNKVYSIANSLLYFSETDTNGGPSAFSNDTTKGAGVINLSNQDSGSESLTSVALYQGKLAIFSKTAVQVWTMNADPKLNASKPESIVSRIIIII